MAVEPSDIKVRLSTASGSAGNTTASTPAASLGKYMSTTDLINASLNNLLPDVTIAEATSGITRYRCVFVANLHASQSWQSVQLWIASQTAGGADIAVGLDPAGAVPIGQTAPQAEQIASETDAPAGVTFSAPVSQAEALSLGNIPAQHCCAVWVRARVTAGAEAVNLDTATLAFYGLSDP